MNQDMARNAHVEHYEDELIARFEAMYDRAEAAEDWGRCAEIERQAERELSAAGFERFCFPPMENVEGPSCYCDPDEGHDCTYLTGGY